MVLLTAFQIMNILFLVNPISEASLCIIIILMFGEQRIMCSIEKFKATVISDIEKISFSPL